MEIELRFPRTVYGPMHSVVTRDECYESKASWAFNNSPPDKPSIVYDLDWSHFYSLQNSAYFITFLCMNLFQVLSSVLTLDNASCCLLCLKHFIIRFLI